MMRASVLAGLLVSSTAFAEPPLGALRSRLPENADVEAWLGLREVGVAHARGPWSAEAALLPRDRVLELRGGRLFPWVSRAHFGLTSAVGVTVVTVVQGPFDVGLGPSVGLTAGWTWTHFLLETGLQAGAEVFFRTGGPRVPVRMLLRVGPRFGQLDLAVTGRAGADFERGIYYALRYDLMLAVRWRFR